MKKTLLILLAICLVGALAGCKDAKQYSVTFLNGEETVKVYRAKEGEEIVPREIVPSAERAADEEFRYVFRGWGTDGEEVVRHIVTADVTLSALFEKVPLEAAEERFTVTFVAEWEGERHVVSTQKVKSGERAVLPAQSEIPLREGYTFSDWDRDVTAPIVGRTEFRAVYERNRYPLVCHVAGKVSREEVLYGAQVSLTPPALPAAILFKGWFSDPDFTSAAVLEKMPAAEVHVYAKCELNWTGAHLHIGSDFVYGGENRVFVAALPSAEGLSYEYLWTDGGRGDSLLLGGAGRHEVGVTVTAVYGDLREERAFSGTADVQKRALSARVVLPPRAVYGETPAPSLMYEGFADGEDETSLSLAPAFDFGETRTPLPAGQYSVSATLPPLDNYDVTVFPAEFTVEKRPLRVRAEAENIVYGETPSPRLVFTGFAANDGEEEVGRAGDPFLYRKAGAEYSASRFTAGEYAVRVKTGALSSDNYAISAEEERPFTVSQKPMTIAVTLEQEALVYGQRPEAQIVRPGFAFSDETEEEVFGQRLAPVFLTESGEAEKFGVGEYTATVRITPPENYAVTVQEASFSVSPKELFLTLAPADAVYGEEVSLPAPALQGFAEGEEGLAAELYSSLRYFLGEGETRQEIPAQGELLLGGEPLPAGSYPLTAEGTAPENYSLKISDSTLSVSRRVFALSSGEVSQNRNKPWSLVPEYRGEKFTAEGKLVLDTRDAGVYTAYSEEELESNHFVWEIPFGMRSLSGKDVTENFVLSYALNVTLNSSRFDITVPSEGLEFVYDGQEHRFEVIVSGEDDTPPSVVYKVNGESSKHAPVLKNAGTYAIFCTVSAENYQEEERSFTVRIARAQYVLQGTREDASFDYDGNAKGERLSAAGVGDEDVSSYLHVRISHRPFLGEPREVGWESVADAGEYTVRYSLSGNDNYESLDERSFVLTVRRAAYGVRAEDQTYVYAPGKSFGKGIEVTVLPGNGYSVRYSYTLDEAREESVAPVFSQAVPEGVEIGYVVAEGRNYESASGSYTVTVRKARGVLDVSGVERRYVYNGKEQRVESGATSNNAEDGEIVYRNNVFTTVAEGNALSVTVRLSEGKNYTGDEQTVSGLTVEKQTLSALPDGVSAPQIGEQVNRMGKTLADVPLPAHFRWQEMLPLTLGTHAYGALYNADADNINDFSLAVSFSTRKQTLSLELLAGEGDYQANASAENYELAGFRLYDEEDSPVEGGERDLVTLTPDKRQLDLSVGGTYPVSCEISLAENDYFELSFGGERTGGEKTLGGETFFKWKTVEAEGVLYTVEDALSRLSAGRATVTHDCTFGPGACYGEEGYEIKQGATLLVPHSEEDNGETVRRKKQAYSPVAERGYCTLSLAGKELSVKGTLIVNALRACDSQKTGSVVGADYGELRLGKDATVRIADGGTFECMGFAYGEGQIVAERGAQVYEPFSMPGWKGGSISCAVRNDVFPLNQYALASLNATTRFQAGARYSLRASVSATLNVFGGEQNLDLTVGFLGADGTAFLELSEGEIEKRTEEDGRTCFSARGNFTFHNFELALSNSLKFDTAGLQAPVPGNFRFALESGSGTIPDGVALKLLPGAEVDVNAGASLHIARGGTLCAYGADAAFDGVSHWQDGGNNMAYPCAALAGCYRGKTDFGYQATTPARLTVGGALTAEEGAVFAARANAREGADLAFEQATLTASVKEDLTPAITSMTGKLQALSGKGGVFFTATLTGGREETRAWKRR